MSTPNPVSYLSKAWTWLKSEWHHIVGYAAIFAAIKKLI
jgi:hypothetical protein